MRALDLVSLCSSEFFPVICNAGYNIYVLFHGDFQDQLGCVVGKVNFPHAADANFLHNSEVRNRLANLRHAFLLIEVCYMLFPAWQIFIKLCRYYN